MSAATTRHKRRSVDRNTNSWIVDSEVGPKRRCSNRDGLRPMASPRWGRQSRHSGEAAHPVQLPAKRGSGQRQCDAGSTLASSECPAVRFRTAPDTRANLRNRPENAAATIAAEGKAKHLDVSLLARPASTGFPAGATPYRSRPSRKNDPLPFNAFPRSEPILFSSLCYCWNREPFAYAPGPHIG